MQTSHISKHKPTTHSAILSRDLVAQLYHATKSPYVTAHMAIATNAIKNVMKNGEERGRKEER